MLIDRTLLFGVYALVVVGVYIYIYIIIYMYNIS